MPKRIFKRSKKATQLELSRERRRNSQLYLAKRRDFTPTRVKKANILMKAVIWAAS